MIRPIKTKILGGEEKDLGVTFQKGSLWRGGKRDA